VAPETPLSNHREGSAPDRADLGSLFHKLNNELGIILVNSELLEHKLADEGQRLRAGLIVSGTLEAMDTIQQLRQSIWARVEAARR
jgi:hypothetical protein